MFHVAPEPLLILGISRHSASDTDVKCSLPEVSLFTIVPAADSCSRTLTLALHGDSLQPDSGGGSRAALPRPSTPPSPCSLVNACDQPSSKDRKCYVLSEETGWFPPPGCGLREGLKRQQSHQMEGSWVPKCLRKEGNTSLRQIPPSDD